MASALKSERGGLCAGITENLQAGSFAESFSESVLGSVQVRLHGSPKHVR